MLHLWGAVSGLMVHLWGLMQGFVGVVWELTKTPLWLVLAVLRVPLSIWWWVCRRKKKPFDFRPPKNNRFFIGLAKLLLPFIMRLGLKVKEVEVDEDGLRRLRGFKGQRVVLTPNHPTGLDPVIMFHLSKMLGDEFNYLAAKDVFELPLVGWFMQRLGCYSIARGTPDRDSFKMTRQLLVEGKRWLVIFPEGETYGQNDTVLPFQQGVTQLAFWALEDLAKQGELPSLYLVPVAIKYVYLKDMRREIDRALRRLERKLSLTINHQTLPLYDRLRRVGEAVLTAAEKQYGVRPPKEADLNRRVQGMKEQILSRAAAVLGVSIRSEQPLSERMRDLLNAVDRFLYEEPSSSEYEMALHRQREQEVRALYDDLERVKRFIAVYDGYVRETLTAERFLDVISRLELELSHKSPQRGPRKAVLKIGEPLNLSDFFTLYRSDKRGVLRDVTVALESSVKEMLTDLGRLTVPLKEVA